MSLKYRDERTKYDNTGTGAQGTRTKLNSTVKKIFEVVTFPVTNPAGRIITATLAITFVGLILMRDEVTLYLRLSVVTVGVVAVGFLFMFLANPRRPLRDYRYLPGLVLASLLMAGVLGLFYASDFGLGDGRERLGGRLGQYIVAYPILTETFNLPGVAWISIRLALLAMATAILLYPKMVLNSGRFLGRVLFLLSIAVFLFGRWATSHGTTREQKPPERLDEPHSSQADLVNAYCSIDGSPRTSGSLEQPTATNLWSESVATGRNTFDSTLYTYDNAREHSTGSPLEQVTNLAQQQARAQNTTYNWTADSTPHNQPNNSSVGPLSASELYGAAAGSPPAVSTIVRGEPTGLLKDRQTSPADMRTALNPTIMHPQTAQSDSGHREFAENILIAQDQHQPHQLLSSVSAIHVVNAAETQHDTQAATLDLADYTDHKGTLVSEEGDGSFVPGKGDLSNAELSNIPRAVADMERTVTSALIPDMPQQDVGVGIGQGDVEIRLPSPTFLQEPPNEGVAPEELASTSRLIETSLAEHGVQASVAQVFPGPTVTKYGITPGWRKGQEGTARVRVDHILSREKDLALALSSHAIRFEPVIPGQSVIGLEIPNRKRLPVTLRSVIDNPKWDAFQKGASIPFPIGLDSNGQPLFADLAEMPHLLVAGTTGSGKSVCINTILAGILLTRKPQETRIVLVDPKMVELTAYQGTPHLYTDVVTEPQLALTVLRALVAEMENRLRTLNQANARNIASYNATAWPRMPYIVVVIDELADLMMTSSSEVESHLIRLSQLARATGVHMVVATQRPSVNVITGVIKANFPSRVCFSVMSQVDSRTVLDSAGGEKLLGKGDMLYMPTGTTRPARVQGAVMTEQETNALVAYWRNQPYQELSHLEVDSSDANPHAAVLSRTADKNNEDDALYEKALELARSQETLSVSLLQRRLNIGFPRAGRLMDQLEHSGVVGSGVPGKPRKVLINFI